MTSQSLDTTGTLAPGSRLLHYVDWGAIVAGTVLASAISIVLFTFGTAIGLSMVSPYAGEGTSRAVYFVALGLWTLWVIVSSFMAGGYLAGRLRRRIGDGTEHEVEVRDGAHGLTVWALGVVIASLLLALGVSGIAGSAAKVAGPSIAASSEGRDDVTQFTVDSLFRPVGRAMPAADNYVERREVSRILTLGTVRGELTAPDKAYVVRLVAGNTGLSQAEAERRVDEVLADAKHKADMARKAGIVIGFLTAAALLIGGAAAAWTATLGGKHRDEEIDLSYFWRWR